MVWGLVGGCVMQIFRVMSCRKMGSLPGAVTQPVVSTPGGNRGQGVRGEMGMNSGKGHRSSEIRIILSEARLAGQRGHVQQHS